MQTTDIQYLADYNYYICLDKNKHVVLNPYEPHEKRSFNNRCRIAGANGPILLSVPLQYGRMQTAPLRDIRICNSENWQKRHWRSLLSSYNASPWFSHFRDSMAELFLSKYEFLIDWNLQCLDWSIRQLRLDVSYRLAELGEVDRKNRAINEPHPTQMNAGSSIRYQQVFENRLGFIPNLSIVDMLFCLGPQQTAIYLKEAT